MTSRGGGGTVSVPVADILPVLVADLAEDDALDVLMAVARADGEAWVPLLAAPIDTSPHLLEVYAPTVSEPLRFRAEPLGPPTERGFPLRLHLHGDGSYRSVMPRAPRDASSRETEPELEAQPTYDAHGSHPPAESRPPTGSRPASGSLPPPARFASTVPPGAASFASSPPIPRADTPTLKPLRNTSAKLTAEHVATLAGQSPSPSPSAEGLLGRTLAGGKLVIESPLSTGEMGDVYRASHRDLRMPVAVKILHESFQNDVEFCRRFYAEALSASRMDHPNLLRVYDFGQEPDGLLYVSMELVSGISLRSILDRGGKLSVTRLTELMLQVCAGLSHAHSRGIVHRDVKPENVTIVASHDDEGGLKEVVKVCDFAIAPRGSKEQARAPGTPEYMSPEQCRGEAVDARADVYACGVVLFELATGRLPFTADKPIKVVNRHLSSPPPSLFEFVPDVDPRLEAIVQKALRKSRHERQSDMRELRAELKTLLEAHTSSVPPGTRRTASLGAFTIPPPEMPPVSLPPPSPSETAHVLRARRPVSSAPPPASSGATSSPHATRSPVSSGSSSSPVERSPSSSASWAAQPEFDAPGSHGPAAHGPAASEPPRPSLVPSRPSRAPEWLEDKVEGYARFLSGMSGSSAGPADLAEALVLDPTTWLTRFASERDATAFAALAAELERAVRVLALRGEARALRAVSSVVHGIATESNRLTGSARAAHANELLRLFADPAMLAPVADRLLVEDSVDAQALVVRAGVAGAYALYGARVKHAASPRVRRPFVATMLALGEASFPVIRAALAKIPPAALTGDHPRASELAEDLLLAVPTLVDEAAGHLVSAYVRASVPALSRAATRALVRLWGERARPLLLGLVTEESGLAAAAILALRELGALDEHAVRRIVPFVFSEDDEARLVALVALGSMTVPARALGVPALAKIVRDALRPDDRTLLAAARSLVSVAPEAGDLVRDRAALCPEPLRSKLLTLVDG